MVEVLGRMISKKGDEGVWKGAKITNNVEPLTHLKFVDDTFLSGEASGREARVIKQTLDDYEQASGKKFNWHKSEIFFFNTDLEKQREIYRVLGMRTGNMSDKYLGIPFFGGARKSNLWKGFIDSCLNKMDG
ncbi:uncharacterized protein LOC131858297 [Cryptomeria japonica]|uniref:uncharacterized protein LOC131858297 n=1 Tax=Cryptomeria japonica TaxID=3369 RepID=UPI0027DAAAB8|nr:uncharacterized protein LOC131858297 [Cryptomeria japonica]